MSVREVRNEGLGFWLTPHKNGTPFALASGHPAKVLSFSLLSHAKSHKQKPTGCLLGACSGQHPMGYRFSLLTLLLSGVVEKLNTRTALSFV
jgi:hypothetical protein